MFSLCVRNVWVSWLSATLLRVGGVDADINFLSTPHASQRCCNDACSIDVEIEEEEEKEGPKRERRSSRPAVRSMRDGPDRRSGGVFFAASTPSPKGRRETGSPTDVSRVCPARTIPAAAAIAVWIAKEGRKERRKRRRKGFRFQLQVAGILD